MSDIAPVIVEVTVTATPDRAFALFTDSIGQWWPVGTNSVYSGTVSFEGDELVERAGDKKAVWGEVTRWDPPAELGLTWYAGHNATHTTDILVTLTARGAETLVRLTHSSWERLLDDNQDARDEYAEGWRPVLNEFVKLVG